MRSYFFLKQNHFNENLSTRVKGPESEPITLILFQVFKIFFISDDCASGEDRLHFTAYDTTFYLTTN